MIFSAALFLMGMISTESLAAHTIAIQIASLAFIGASGPRPGGDSARRRGLWRA